MDAAHSWHPGTDRIASIWPVPVPLLPDELISSWLVRAALAQGCDPLALTGMVWPKWRAWTLDVDRVASEDRLLALSAPSGIPTGAFQWSTLQPTAQLVHGADLLARATWPWILTLGARNTRRRGGLQYCPHCLAEDAHPHYRLHWRFAWHTGCEKHGVSLLDRCWNCGSPLEPHRLLATDRHAGQCATCKADLGAAQAGRCHEDAMRFQQEADCVVHEGRSRCLDRSVATAEWFVLADFFVSLIRRTSRSRGIRLIDLMDRLGVQLPEDLPLVAGEGVERLHVGDRQRVLGAVWNLIRAGRGEFEVAVKASGLSRQGLFGKGEAVPAVLADLVEALPDHPSERTSTTKPHLMAPRPRHQVMRMMARLERLLKAMPK